MIDAGVRFLFGCAPADLLLDAAGRENLDLGAYCESDPTVVQQRLARVRPQDTSDILFTSGTTGQPKGVMIEHRGMSSLAITQIDIFGLKPDSRVMQFASFSFDACLWEFLMAWSCGGSLHLATREHLMPGEPLLDDALESLPGFFFP